MTDTHQCPAPIKAYIDNRNRQYEGKRRGDYSVTQLIKPAQQHRLWRAHEGEIAEDYTDFYDRFLGHAIHAAIEEMSTFEKEARYLTLTEARYFADIDGLTISGQIDSLMLIDGILDDYKTAKVSSFGRDNPDYANQLNFYAWLLRRNGYEVKQARVVKLYNGSVEP